PPDIHSADVQRLVHHTDNRHDAHSGGVLKLSHQTGHSLVRALLVKRVAAAIDSARPPFERIDAFLALDLAHAVMDPVLQLVAEPFADIVGYSHRAFLKEASRGRPGIGTYKPGDPLFLSLLDRAEEANAAQQAE